MRPVFAPIALFLVASITGAQCAENYIGTERWTGTPTKLCDKPEDPSAPRQCILYSGRLKIVSSTNDAFGGTAFFVETTDGRNGYVSADYPLLSDAEHAAIIAKLKRGPCAQRGEPTLGMIANQIYATCWGYPAHINTTVSVGGKIEQWVYPGRGYLYLRDSILSGIQTTR